MIDMTQPEPLTRRKLLAAAATAASFAFTMPARASSSGAPQIVKHDMQPLQGESESFALVVLRLLMDKTIASHGPYQFDPLSPRDSVTQSRTMIELRAGALDVVASMNSLAREDDGIQVRACLRRGLNGLRLPVCLASRQAEMEGILNLQQAKQLSLGQVAHWPDAMVLEKNGLKVQRVQRLANFDAMLERGRFDIFPLASDEAFGIVEALPKLVVLKQWLFAYPSTFAFMVNHARPELAERLRHGWKLVQADGSFEAIHDKAVGGQVRQAHLAERRWLTLSNPDQPPQALRQDAKLWHPLVRQRLIEPLLKA
ncbi:type 2 periplasmic-binding domain-containing protein [Roseateles oligotrophus]|uniref:ABC-type amino acid transport substrate-binding protein n=1 Tax=Roseateles oligotrophus TaxID=1769250 RepID=A0ABT2YBF7_9BURK|nr:hypothetical protein [Roseateles oligotrophus]MCV2367545.1 hypothetical protein [Roseateles oligotrophus]